jgi:hypothetical protein
VSLHSVAASVAVAIVAVVAATCEIQAKTIVVDEELLLISFELIDEEEQFTKIREPEVALVVGFNQQRCKLARSKVDNSYQFEMFHR